MVAAAVLSFVTDNLFSLLVFGAILLCVQWLLRQPKNLPPGPTRYPIIGNLEFIGETTYKVFWRFFQKYGGIVTFYIGNLRCVLLTDIDVIKETATTQADVFSTRSLPPILDWTIRDDGSLFFGNGHEWKERRKFTMHALRNFGVGKKSLEYSINEEARAMLEAFSEEGGKPFDPSVITTYVISNVICKINFGKRFDYTDKDFRTIIDKFRSIFQSFQLTGLVSVFPILTRTPLYSYIPKGFRELKEYILGLIKEHSESLDENDVRDLIDMYLLEIKRQQESGEEVLFRPEQAWRLILETFGGGTDTTTNTLLFGIMLTSMNPEIQKKVQVEIDAVIGRSRQPSSEDRPQMPYTDAVLMETQRFRPVAVLAPPHGVFHDTQLAGYDIPEGTQVFFNIWGLLHDPKLWKNADQFDPTNFLSEDGKTVIRPDHFMPFGMGRRACIGENLAKMEIFLFFTNLFQRFTFTLPEDEPTPSTEPVVGIIARPQRYRICATPRAE